MIQKRSYEDMLLNEEVAVAICNYLLPLVAMFRVAVVAHILSS